MRTNHGWMTISLLATLTWSTKIEPSAAYFQTTAGGYTFSIPTFSNAEKRNQTDARTWCNGNQSKLLEIRNNDIQIWTKWFIASAIGQNQMTGNTIIANGKRSNSPFTWANGIRITDITVKGQEPGFSHSYAYITVTQSGFEIFADTTTVKRGYICEGSSFCSNGFKVRERCYNAYTAYSDQASWFNARNLCTDRGGDLASFDFISNDGGFNVLNGSGLNPSSTYWIGLRRQFWAWQDSKSDVVYSQWSNGHPDYATNLYKECLCLESNLPTYDWKWSECDCNQLYQFVCMTGTSLTSSAAPVTSANPLTPSTTIAGDTRATHSLNTPSSVSNFGSISTAACSSPVAVSNNTALTVGLGVGLGVGIPMAIIILILALMIAHLRRKLKSFETNRNIPLDGVPMAAKEGSATTYESLKKDGQTTDNRTYEELTIRENIQNSDI